MATPSLMTVRRFSPQTRLRLQVLFARAWESLAETHKSQAAEFVRRLRSRLTIEEALDRYFREIGVPAPMAETVRARALVTLAPLIEDVALAEESPAAGWSPLRPDQMIGALRRRAQQVEETSLECRMAASLSGEALAATHVEMAIETAELLADECTPDESIMHYIRTFDLSSIDAQLVFRRALARWAERDPMGVQQVDPEIALAVCAPAPRFESRLRLSLRAIG